MVGQTTSNVATGEAALIRECSGLYASFAFESLSSVLLSIMFMYLVLLILCKHRLNNPGLAVLKMIRKWFVENFVDFWDTLKNWQRMASIPLEGRFAFCRKLNMSICGFSALVSLLAVTRWLHVGNVNGFRYLGYALTCPLMQSELIILIAPIVPCFKLNVIFTAFVTFSTMIAGYAGSLMSGGLWTGSVTDFVHSWAMVDLEPTTKFWVVSPCFIGLGFLTFVQIPWLAFLYTCRGGTRHCAPGTQISELPRSFRRLLLYVAVTWLSFPVFWLLSSEGLSIVSDTKWNGFAFAVSNIISKSGFTLHLLSMVRWHKRQWGRRTSVEDVNMSACAADEAWFITLLKPFDGQEVEIIFDADAEASRSVAHRGANGVSPAKTGWASIDQEYRRFLESAGVGEVDFYKAEAMSRVSMRMQYLQNSRKGSQIAIDSGSSTNEGSDSMISFPLPETVSATDQPSTVNFESMVAHEDENWTADELYHRNI